MAKLNGNLKWVASAIVIVVFIAGIGAAWAVTNAKAECAMEKAESVEDKQNVVNEYFHEDIIEIKTDVREMRMEQRRLMEHLNVPKEK